MTAPIVVTVPLEALEAAQQIRQCDNAQCDLYATLTVATGAPFVRRITFLCDTHAQGAHTKAPTCWADHARALNRAIEWGREMRAMKEGKL